MLRVNHSDMVDIPSGSESLVLDSRVFTMAPRTFGNIIKHLPQEIGTVFQFIIPMKKKKFSVSASYFLVSRDLIANWRGMSSLKHELMRSLSIVLLL